MHNHRAVYYIDLINQLTATIFQGAGQAIHFAAVKGEADVIELLVDGHGVNPGVLTEVKMDKMSTGANIFFTQH